MASVAASVAENSAASDDCEWRGLRVASVDDDELARFVDTLAFEELGIEAHVRGASAEEIEGFPDFVSGLAPPPHAVLIDYRLDQCVLSPPPSPRSSARPHARVARA